MTDLLFKGDPFYANRDSGIGSSFEFLLFEIALRFGIDGISFLFDY